MVLTLGAPPLYIYFATRKLESERRNRCTTKVSLNTQQPAVSIISNGSLCTLAPFVPTMTTNKWKLTVSMEKSMFLLQRRNHVGEETSLIPLSPSAKAVPKLVKAFVTAMAAVTISVESVCVVPIGLEMPVITVPMACTDLTVRQNVLVEFTKFAQPMELAILVYKVMALVYATLGGWEKVAKNVPRTMLENTAWPSLQSSAKLSLFGSSSSPHLL